MMTDIATTEFWLYICSADGFMWSHSQAPLLWTPVVREPGIFFHVSSIKGRDLNCVWTYPKT